MKFRTKRILSFLICLFVVVFTATITINGIINGASVGQLGEGIQGLGYFKAFTMDSNIFCALTMLVVGCYDLRWFMGGKKCTGLWVTGFQLMGATSAVVTFLTVFLFLIPVRLMNGEAAWPMMSGDMMFLHILNPILAAVEFIFFRWRRRIRVWECLVTMVPIFAYGSVYGFMVFITGEWDDFYGLTFGGDLRWGIASLGALMLMALLVSSVLSFAGKRNKRMRRGKRSGVRTARGGRATGERLEHI